MKWKKVLFAVLLVAAGMLLFAYPDAAATGASRGLSVCGTVIIPGLLPMLVLVGTFMRSALCDTVSRWLARPTAWVFRLPGVCAAPILLSFIGGYPAGAVAVEQLLDEGQITEREAARLLRFCVNAGPAFTVSTVGAMLLRDARIGWMLLAAQLAAAIFIGIAQGWCAPRMYRVRAKARSFMPFSLAFTEAVNAATKALLYMCGFVILFSVILSLLDGMGQGQTALLSGLLEVTSGCVILAGERELFIALLGFLLGFGGLSVHCQIRAVLHAYPQALKGFGLFRMLSGLLCGAFSYILYHTVPLSVKTFAVGTATVQPFTATPTVSLVLLCMSGCFLLCSEKKIAKQR